MRISDWSSDVCSADLKPQLRCLIPLTAWAEPAGIKGSKTRTWLSLKDRPIFAWGGLWRDSAEWGPVYSGAMTDANEVAAKRSEERRVGKEWVSTGRSRWATDHETKKRYDDAEQ